SSSAVPAALAKAERYRLLNEPAQAESICLDVLQVEPDNEQALVSLLLALTDQFSRRPGAVREAKALLPKLQTEYDRVYYAGVVCERHALNELHSTTPGAAYTAYEELQNAMGFFE